MNLPEATPCYINTEYNTNKSSKFFLFKTKSSTTKNHLNHILFKLIFLLCEKCLRHPPHEPPQCTENITEQTDRYAFLLCNVSYLYIYIRLRREKKSYLYAENCENVKLHYSSFCLEMGSRWVVSQHTLLIEFSIER